MTDYDKAYDEASKAMQSLAMSAHAPDAGSLCDEFRAFEYEWELLAHVRHTYTNYDEILAKVKASWGYWCRTYSCQSAPELEDKVCSARKALQKKIRAMVYARWPELKDVLKCQGAT